MRFDAIIDSHQRTNTERGGKHPKEMERWDGERERKGSRKARDEREGSEQRQ